MQGTEIDRDEEIRQLAYRLWQESGCPNGSDLQHWLKAQEIVAGKTSSEKSDQASQSEKTKTNSHA